ncbi:hypothetical protein E4T56_gene8518 [Termitomyces sp. T112]|nr:hypothetical protein E4T56_gene8518 [Termitomyces sp. T112]
MTQPTPPAPPPDASSPQDDAWSRLLSLETQVQLTQASLTSYMAKLTGLHQTTEAVSLSLQALLEHLPLAPTTPLMPSADAERFVSAPSSGLLAPAAAEQFASASGLGLSAPCSKLPHPALPDVYNGDCKAGERFLQSYITYIQPSGEAFTSDALKIAWVFSYMKAAKVSARNTLPSTCPRIPAWERCLPHCYVVASTPSTNSLKLQVEIETTDTQQIQSVVALLDSGATGLFLDTDYVQQHRLTTCPLSCPIPVYNVDGMLNEAGSIHSVVDLVLHYQDHSERAAFAVTSLGKQDMILGFTWLHEHNPEIDWTKEEAHIEWRAKVHECAAIHACCAGHLPYADLDLLSPPPLAFPYREALYEDVQGVGCESPEEEEGGGEWTHTPDAESPDENIEVGDWIYATTLCLPPAVAEIQASQTTSQHLAEAFAANSQPKPFPSTVSNHLHDFEDVFSKASFDSLPERKQWDHVIELIPDAEPSSCKVYPLAPHEQDELDAFLQENLSSG